MNELQPIPKGRYTTGCLMLYVKYTNLHSIHTWIPEKHIYRPKHDPTAYGYEGEPHITILSGINEGISRKRIEDFVKLLDVKYPENLELDTQMTFFDTQNKEGLALKFDVKKNKQINDIHRLAKLEIPNNFLYPDYLPHLTIAYIKKEYKDRYSAIDTAKINRTHTTERQFVQQVLTQNKRYQTIEPMYYVYTTSAGNKFIIK